MQHTFFCTIRSSAKAHTASPTNPNLLKPMLTLYSSLPIIIINQHNKQKWTQNSTLPWCFLISNILDYMMFFLIQLLLFSHNCLKILHNCFCETLSNAFLNLKKKTSKLLNSLSCFFLINWLYNLFVLIVVILLWPTFYHMLISSRIKHGLKKCLINVILCVR